MALTIAKKGEGVRFNPDYVLKNTALASSGAITSSAFQLGSTQGFLQINVESTNALVAGSAITVDYQTADTEAGSYASELKITVPAGTYTNKAIAKFIPVKMGKQWAKLVITTAENLSASTVSAYPTSVFNGR